MVFLASPLTFDPSVVDIFLTLTSGAQLLIVPTIIKKMPNRLAQLLFISHKTTVLQVTVRLAFFISITMHLCIRCTVCVYFAGHTNFVMSLWAQNPERGSVVMWVLVACLGSGWRGMSISSTALNMETQGQQNSNLQHLRNH